MYSPSAQCQIIHMHVHSVLHILAMGVVRGWHLFCSDYPIERLLFEGGDYSRLVNLKKYGINDLSNKDFTFHFGTNELCMH